MTKDNRKNYFMGVSPGEWLMVGIMAFGGAIAYGASFRQIEQNSDNIIKHEDEHITHADDHKRDIKDLREDFKNEVKEINDRIKDTNSKVDKVYEILIRNGN
jgi:peptidoglycan hydrolase CwlO-like protein